MASDSTSVGVDSMDDAAPDGDELAARLADVVFEWQPACSTTPAAADASVHWMSRRAREGSTR